MFSSPPYSKSSSATYVQYPSDARYKAFHTRTRLLLVWNGFSQMSKCVCSVCKTCETRVKLVCPIGTNAFALLVKLISQRIQRVCSVLNDSHTLCTCSPAVSVSMYVYHMDNLPTYCFLKSHSCCTSKSFWSRKKVLQNFGRWLEWVLCNHNINFGTTNTQNWSKEMNQKQINNKLTAVASLCHVHSTPVTVALPGAT